MKLSKGITQVIFANIVNLIISIGNGFLLPKYLSVESYASLKTFLLYSSYVGVLHFGYIDGIYMKYGGKTINEIDVENLTQEKKILALFQVMITLPIILAAFLLWDFNLLFAAVSILPINMVTFFKFIYQATGEFSQYRKITNFTSILIFFLNMVFLFLARTDISICYIITQVVVYFIVWIFYECKNRIGYAGISITFREVCIRIKDNISLGIIIMLGNFMGIWITSIDRWFVKMLCSVVEFAYYSFAVTMLRLINVVVTAFSVTLYNFFCKEHTMETIARLRKIVLISGSAIIVLIFPIDFIVQTYLEKYNGAVPVIRLLFIAQFILIGVNAIYLNLYKALNLQKKYFIGMIIVTVVAFLSNAVISYLWNNNIIAYALATLFTSFIWLILCQIDLPKYKMGKREWIYILLTIIVYFVCNSFSLGIGMLSYVSLVSLGAYFIFPKDIKLLFEMIIATMSKRGNL